MKYPVLPAITVKNLPNEGLEALAQLRIEATYGPPATILSLQRAHALVESHLNLDEEDLLQIREDPKEFASAVRSAGDHRLEMLIRRGRGEIPGAQPIQQDDMSHWRIAVRVTVQDTLSKIDRWSSIAEATKVLCRAHEAHALGGDLSTEQRPTISIRS